MAPRGNFIPFGTYATDPTEKRWPSYQMFVVIVALSAQAISMWTKRSGWNAQHLLALAKGVIGLLVIE
ncbi:MAG TPA: hypothetical protein VIX20_17850 [Ktedonobacteraceae bacterium]